MESETSGGLRSKDLQRRIALAAGLIGIIILTIGFGIYEFTYESGIQDYISDEVWYVSSARTILLKYFGATPTGLWDGMVRVTIQLSYPPSEKAYAERVDQARAYIEGLGGRLVKGKEYYQYKSNGDFLPAICVDVPPEKLPAVNNTPYSSKYAVGYCYPNAKNILDYTNPEHPPLVKYLIGISMVTLGDRPEFWRIPSIIAGALILILIFLSMRAILGNVMGGLLGAVAALLTVLDISFRSLSMVALLDIFVALFTYLTYYFTLRGKLTYSSIALGFGFVSKFSGAFAGVPPLIEWIKKEKPAKVLLLLIYVPVLILILISIPFIIKDGFMDWWSVSVGGAFKWHLSQKTTGGPPQAMPWDWLLGRNPFPLHYVQTPTGEWKADLIAAGNPALYLLTTALSIYLIPVFRRLADRGVTYVFTWGTYLMYIAIYVLGAKTQYSFYFIQIIPLLYTLLLLQLHFFLDRPKRVLEVGRKWVEIFRTFIDWLAGLVRVKVEVRVEPVEEL